MLIVCNNRRNTFLICNSLVTQTTFILLRDCMSVIWIIEIMFVRTVFITLWEVSAFDVYLDRSTKNSCWIVLNGLTSWSMRWLNRVDLSRSGIPRAGWRDSHWTKKLEPATLLHTWEEINIGDLRVSFHRAMVEEFISKPSAIVVAKNEDQGGLKLWSFQQNC